MFQGHKAVPGRVHKIGPGSAKTGHVTVASYKSWSTPWGHGEPWLFTSLVVPNGMVYWSLMEKGTYVECM